jgi:hypothetical protein
MMLGGLWRGVQQDQLPPWPEDAPLPPPLHFTRAVLHPPHDPLDASTDDDAATPKHWVQMHDMAGLYHFTMCEHFSEEQPVAARQNDRRKSSGEVSPAPASKASSLSRRRKVAHAAARWEWPWLGQAASCRDFLGLGYTLGAVEDVTVQVFCIPTEHFQHTQQLEGASPFAKRAKEQLRAREARARSERRRQRLEEDKLKPIWQRGNDSMRSEGLNDTAMTGFSAALSVASDAPKESSRTGARMQKDGVLSDAAQSGGKRQQGRRKKKAKHTNKPSAARRVLIAVERIIVRGEGGGGEQAQVVL